MVNRINSLSKLQILAIVLILGGAALMVARLRGMIEFSREAQYAAQNNFSEGNLSPDLIRPWMSLRYIAVAYAVPQKYLYDKIGVQPRPETSMLGVNRLNRQMGLGQADGKPALMSKIRQAIIDYRANPVATGLMEQNVQHWMTVQYIANSIGVPAEAIFRAINLEADATEANQTLGFLADRRSYPGGVRQLEADLQAAILRLVPPNPPAVPPPPTPPVAPGTPARATP